MFIKKTTLTDIGNSVRQKLGTSGSIKVTELSQKILEIPTGGGSGDLIDVETFPTTNVQDDKVYRIKDSSIDLYQIIDGETISFSQVAGELGLNIYFYPINKISEIKNPIETDINTTTWNIYIENLTGFAYLYVNMDGTSPQWVTFGGLDGDIKLDRGFTTNISQETENGYYVYKVISIGVPNVSGGKKIYSWNGKEWLEQQNISKVLFGRVYKTVERFVYPNSDNTGNSGMKITYYAKFYEDYTEWIVVLFGKGFVYQRLNKNGEYTNIAQDQTINSSNCGSVGYNGSTATITFIPSNANIGITNEQTFVNSFIFAIDGLFAKGIHSISSEEIEEDGWNTFVLTADLFRGGDFDLMDDNSEWDSIVAEQGWNIP